MNKIKALLLCCALLFGLLTGCGAGNSEITQPEQKSSTTAEQNVTESKAKDMFSDRDLEGTYTEEKSVKIQLEGDTATASSDSVKISGGIITIREEATYVISGELTNGMLLVDADDAAKIQIVLDGVTIQNETSAAIYIKEADKVFLSLAEGSENVLGNGGTFETVDDSNVDAALFSKQDLTINGTGSITVTSPAGHGIVCKDDLVCAGGTYRIEAASHGMEANDSVRIAEGVSLKIIAGKDGIHCENDEDATLGYVYVSGGSIDIEAEGDGISAGASLEVEAGEFTLLTGGGSENGTKASSDFYGGFGGMRRPGEQSSSTNTETEDSTSMKGMKAEGTITVTGGSFTINSADDSVHSNSSITINGGIYVLESGDDAIHADDTLTVTACDMTVSGSYEGLEAEKIYIQGGNLVIHSDDDGLNASGGSDASGTTGGRDGMFGGGRGGMHGGMPGGGMPGGGMPGGGMSGSSTGIIEISEGNLTIYASGDGIDSNGSLTISGGYIYVANPSSGDTSVLDADITPVITGGTFLSTGATQMMAQSFSEESTQGVIACTVGNQKAGSMVSVADSDGNLILEYEAEYSFVLVIISSPKLVKGETYTLTVGSASGTMTAD